MGLTFRRKRRTCAARRSFARRVWKQDCRSRVNADWVTIVLTAFHSSRCIWISVSAFDTRLITYIAMENSVELRISNLGARAASTRALLPLASLDGPDVVIRCPAGTGESLSQKLVWLWGMLKHRRRALKTLQADGATLVCVCAAPRGPVVLQPNAAEFLHLTGASLVVTVDAA